MSDRARRRGGVETNEANDRVDGKSDRGATREIAAHISAERQAANGQSDESRGLAEDGWDGIPPYCGGAARRLTRMARVEFHKHDWLLPGFGGKRRLTAPTVRFLVGDRARVMHGSATGIDHWRTGSRRGDPSAARASTHAGR
jgi:hypothetical protein